LELNMVYDSHIREFSIWTAILLRLYVL